MIRALKVPTSVRHMLTLVDLEKTDEYLLNKDSKDGPNPYFVAKEILGDYAERVRTAREGIFLYVDESGQLKRQALNEHASYLLYPGALAGNVLIVRERQVGPDIILEDLNDADLVYLVGTMGASLDTTV